MPRKCSVYGCSTNYKVDKKEQKEKVSVYRFPKDEEKCKEWVNALPNKIAKVTEYMGICALHWPAGVEMIRKGGKFAVPTVPPSVFPNVPQSCIPLRESSSTPRTTAKATAKARAVDIDEMAEFLKRDSFHSDTFQSTITEKLKSLHGSVVFQSEDDQDFFFFSHCRKGPIHELAIYFKIIKGPRSLSVSYEAYLNLKQVVHPSIKVMKRWSEVDEFIRFLKHHDLDDKKVSFLCRSVELLNAPKNGRVYSVNDILQAFSWYSISRALYDKLRMYVQLPSVATLQRITCMAKNTSDQALFSSVFRANDARSKYCILIIDEVYVKASLTYRGGTVYGHAVDRPDKTATTLLCIMVKCFFGSQKFIAKILPCHALTAKFQFDQVLKVMELLEICGGTVVAIINDNNRVNQAFFNMFESQCPEKPWIVRSPQDQSSPLFLMYDTVHLLKNIRNNWITEKVKALDFVPEGSTETITARWTDLQELHDHERNTLLKLSDLTPAAISPSNIEKQKVSLVLNVFSEKTSSALKSSTSDSSSASWKNTAIFIDEVLRLWKVFNTKTPVQSILLRDNDRVAITESEKNQIDILNAWASRAQEMKTSSGPRIRCLTKDTANALSWTCRCLIDMCEFLLTTETPLRHQFVTIGFFQQDDIEKHFAHFRMAAGCNFFITAQDVSHTHAIDRTKLMLQNDPDIDYSKSQHTCEFCRKDLTDAEILILDDISSALETVTSDEKMALLYIGGYIASKHIGLQGEPCYLPDNVREYTENIDRGGLTYPSESFLNLLGYIYVFFQQSKEPSCRRRLVDIFMKFPSLFHIDVEICTSSVTRIVNILMKRFCVNHQRQTSSEQKRRKIAKLSSTTAQ